MHSCLVRFVQIYFQPRQTRSMNSYCGIPVLESFHSLITFNDPMLCTRTGTLSCTQTHVQAHVCESILLIKIQFRDNYYINIL